MKIVFRNGLAVVLGLFMIAGCGQNQAASNQPPSGTAVEEINSPDTPSPSQTTSEADSESSPSNAAPGQPQSAPVSTPPTSPATAALPDTLEGVVTSVRGTVSLQRDGRDVSNELDIGFVLRDYDLVSTGGNGSLTAEFRGPGLPGATLSMSPNSKVYVEQSMLSGGGTKTTVQMLTGTIALNVQKLAGSQVGVNTQSAALGVRGTRFDVIIAPQLEVLVTCSEGQVNVVQGDQRSSAVPGRVVASVPEDGLAEYSVQVSNISKFQDRWFELVMADFEEMAIPLLKTVYRRWGTNLARFSEERSRLSAQNTILAKWRTAVDSGQSLGAAEILRDKRSVAPILLSLKKAMYFFERDWAWLATVQKDFPAAALDEDIGGITARQFFQEYGALQRDLGIQFSEVRGAFRLLAALDPDSPLGDFFAESDF